MPGPGRLAAKYVAVSIVPSASRSSTSTGATDGTPLCMDEQATSQLAASVHGALVHTPRTLLDPPRMRGEHRRNALDQRGISHIQHRPLSVEREVGKRQHLADDERLLRERPSRRFEQGLRAFDEHAALGRPAVDTARAVL